MTRVQFIVAKAPHADKRTVEQRLLNDRGQQRHHMCMTPGGCRRTGMHADRSQR